MTYLALWLVAAACGAGAEGSAVAETGTCSMTIPIQRPGDELSLYSYVALPEWYLHRNISETLVRLGVDDAIEPGAARSWQTRDSGKTYIFDLRSDLVWSDGRQMTAQHILRSVFLRAGHRSARLLPSMLRPGPIDKAVYLDDRGRLVVRLKADTPAFLRQLTRPEWSIVRYADAGNLLTSATVTSGDYAIVSVSRDRVVLAPNSRRSDLPPRLPRMIRFQRVENREDILKLVDRGEVGILEIDSQDIFERVQASGQYQIIEGALDNLATLQSRRLDAKAKAAIGILAEYLDRADLIRGKPGAVPAWSFLASSSAPAKPRLSREETAARLEGRTYRVVLELGEDATSWHIEDAKRLRAVAREFGVTIDVELGLRDFQKRREQEDYPLTLVTMGVRTFDEVQLMHGYLCAGFRPYRSVGRGACDSIGRAARPSALPSEIRHELDAAYARLAEQTSIITLYHFPRSYAVHRSLKLRSYNARSPYPYFRSLECR